MTLVSQIITDAYRESNLIPLVSTPNTNQVTEGLRRLNVILLSTVGNEAGDDFMDVNIGGEFDQSFSFDQWLPADVRLILNLSADIELDLDPYAKNGNRLAISDAADNLATNTLTLNGNGRTIEDSSTVVLNTDGLDRQWLYRSDISNWVRISEVLSTDQMPFPSQDDDYFVTMLAMRLNPRYGATMAPGSVEALKRSRAQLRARYNRQKPIVSDVNPRGFRMDTTRFLNDSEDDFSRGRV